MKNFVFLLLILFLSQNSWAQTENEVAGNYYNEGTKLIGEKKFKEAIVQFDQAIAIIPHFPEAIFNKGTCLLILKENNEACNYISQSAQMGYEPAIKYKNKYCLKQSQKKGNR